MHMFVGKICNLFAMYLGCCAPFLCYVGCHTPFMGCHTPFCVALITGPDLIGQFGWSWLAVGVP
jgi:hypothetical protein